MEGTEVEARDKDRKLQIAVRRAKAALLLSSLKSSANRVFKAANNDEFEVRASCSNLMFKTVQIPFIFPSIVLTRRR